MAIQTITKLILNFQSTQVNLGQFSSPLFPSEYLLCFFPTFSLFVSDSLSAFLPLNLLLSPALFILYLPEIMIRNYVFQNPFLRFYSARLHQTVIVSIGRQLYLFRCLDRNIGRKQIFCSDGSNEEYVLPGKKFHQIPGLGNLMINL